MSDDSTRYASEFFSASYAEATGKFLAAARAAKGARCWGNVHPVAATRVEPLYTHIARQGPGPRETKDLLVISSGVHGPEGYVGSAAQTEALATGYLEQDRPASMAALYVHAVNPLGFESDHRVTEGNVDVNRNCVDWKQPFPAQHPQTAEINRILLPAEWSWPPPGFDEFIQTYGPATMQAAVSQGQYTIPNGLFYGGTEPVWSNTSWHNVVRAEITDATQRIFHVDIHSGLGLPGQGKLLMSESSASAAFSRAGGIWGSDTLESVVDGQSVSAPITGDIFSTWKNIAPGREVTAIAIEYGTVPVLQVLEALALDNWVRAQGGKADRALVAEARVKMRAAFCPDDPQWQETVAARSRQVLGQVKAFIMK